MAKCIRCGDNVYDGNKICYSCLHKWAEMRSMVFDALEKLHGKFSQQNQFQFKKDMKKMTALWKRDKEKFEIEFNLLSKL